MLSMRSDKESNTAAATQPLHSIELCPCLLQAFLAAGVQAAFCTGPLMEVIS